MWLKIVIVVLFVAICVSLLSGYFFLMKDQGKTNRTLNSLGARVVLAVLLLGFMAYGIKSGKLNTRAHWDATVPTEAPQQEEAK